VDATRHSAWQPSAADLAAASATATRPHTRVCARAGANINLLYVFLMIVGHTLLLLFPVRWLIRWVTNSAARHGRMTTAHFFLYLCIVLCNAWVTEFIGITTLVGAFQIGVLTPRNNPLETGIPAALENLVVVVLM
jgi:Kef-type K+ transport system membrane component KefB